MRYELHFGDFRDKLKGLPSDAVIVTDPPYNIGFNYGGEYIDNLPDDEYIELLCELQILPTVICQYPEEMMKYVVPSLGIPDDVLCWCYNSNIRRNFRLFNIYGLQVDYTAVKQPYKNPLDKRVRALTEMGADGAAMYDWFSDIQLVKNVSKEKTEHPCPLPVALIERVIRMTTKPGQTVVDPFGGTFTTGIAALRAGRNFVGCEQSEKFFGIGKQRLDLYASQSSLFESAPTFAVASKRLEAASPQSQLFEVNT